MPDAWFAKLDTDQSGALSTAELEAAPARPFGKGDGGHRGLPGDADGDGVLTKAEAITGAQGLAKRLDQNGDGKLTKEELGRFHGRGHHARRAARAMNGGHSDV